MQPSAPASPRQLRVARHEQTATQLAAILVDLGLTKAELAAELGVPAQHVAEWCDPEGERSIRVADARGAKSADLRRRLGELLAGPDSVFSKKPEPSSKSCDVAQVAKLVRSSAGLVDHMLLAHDDGHVSPDEARELIRRVDALSHHLAELRGALEDVASVPSPVTRLRRPA